VALRIIGCGKLDRGDDAAGLLVARRLHAVVVDQGVDGLGVEIRNVTILEQSGESFSLMDCWASGDDVILVDATAPMGTPGKIQVWNACADKLPEDAFPCSTHGFGVREAVELARVLGRLPLTLLICGIEGKRFSLGATVSPEVDRAVESVAQELLERARTTAGPCQTMRKRTIAG